MLYQGTEVVADLGVYSPSGLLLFKQLWGKMEAKRASFHVFVLYIKGDFKPVALFPCLISSWNSIYSSAMVPKSEKIQSP